MQDLALNSNFSVYLDDRNDLATVEGNAAFEQHVVVMLTDYMHRSLPGITGSDDTVKEKIRLQVTRVARDNSVLDSVSSIDVREKDGEPGTYEVQILYDAGDSFEFDIQP